MSVATSPSAPLITMLFPHKIFPPSLIVMVLPEAASTEEITILASIVVNVAEALEDDKCKNEPPILSIDIVELETVILSEPRFMMPCKRDPRLLKFEGPTERATSPLLPLFELPDATMILPEDPLDVVPVVKIRCPLTPVVPAFKVLIVIEPLVSAIPQPAKLI